MAVLDAIATAYLDRERQRLGLPSRRELEEKRAIEARAAAQSASQLESADASRDLTRARIAEMPGEAEQRRRLVEAQISNYAETAQPRAEPSSELERVMAMDPAQQAQWLKLKQQVAGMSRPPQSTEPKPISPAIESNIINRLTTQWDKANSTVNELKRQRDMMQTGLAAARKGDMAAGSQAVLVTFQKILDPTSVVRESEYARSAAGQAVLARIQGAAERLAQGGAGVPVAELEAFAALADQFVQQATSSGTVANIRARIGATADRYRIPHDVIFGAEQSAPPAMTAPSAPAPEATWIEVAPGIRKKVKK